MSKHTKMIKRIADLMSSSDEDIPESAVTSEKYVKNELNDANVDYKGLGIGKKKPEGFISDIAHVIHEVNPLIAASSDQFLSKVSNVITNS